MARATGPLMSEGARKKLGHSLIFKQKGNKTFITRYTEPGDQNKLKTSAEQETQRSYLTEAGEAWQNLSAENKQKWNDFVFGR